MAAHRDPEVLRRLYHGQGMSLREVGDRLDVSRGTVRKWMERHGIERRGRSEAVGLAAGADPRLRDGDWLRERYEGDGRSLNEIADELGVSDSAVLHQMRRHGVGRRDRSGAVSAALRRARPPDRRLADPDGPLDGDESLRDAARRLVCSHGAVLHRLRR